MAEKYNLWEYVEIMWIHEKNCPDAIASMRCPVCGRFTNHVYLYGDPTHLMNYCPNCGSKMKEIDNG